MGLTHFLKKVTTINSNSILCNKGVKCDFKVNRTPESHTIFFVLLLLYECVNRTHVLRIFLLRSVRKKL